MSIFAAVLKLVRGGKTDNHQTSASPIANQAPAEIILAEVSPQGAVCDSENEIQPCESAGVLQPSAKTRRGKGKGKGKYKGTAGADGLTGSERRGRDKLRTLAREGQRANKAARRAGVEEGLFGC